MVLFLLATVLSGISLVSAADEWKPVNLGPWVQIDLPPGFTPQQEIKNSPDSDTLQFSAFSPDRRSEIKYLLNHVNESVTVTSLQEFQNKMMSNLGFRICKTKDPVIKDTGKNISVKQVFVKGTDDGAVMFSAAYPGWGTYHYILLMSGSQAVAKYYDLIPSQMQDHVRPVMEQ